MKNKAHYNSRERKLLQKKTRWKKHGEGKWFPVQGISKAYKKILRSKIKFL